MPIVTYDGHEFECATALKGADYIRLLDAAGCKIVAFEGVVDFSTFTITDGDWTNAPAADDCYIVTASQDGSLHTSSKKACEVSKGGIELLIYLHRDDAQYVEPSEELPTGCTYWHIDSVYNRNWYLLLDSSLEIGGIGDSSEQLDVSLTNNGVAIYFYGTPSRAELIVECKLLHCGNSDKLYTPSSSV